MNARTRIRTRRGRPIRRAALVVTVTLGASYGAHTAYMDGRAHTHTHDARIPTCAEDHTYLRGEGNFERGVWSRYVCVHPDTLNAP